MRTLVCLLAVPLVLGSCGRDPLNVDPNARGLGAEETERDQEIGSDGQGGEEGSKEAPIIDEPDGPAQPMPGPVVMNPDGAQPPEQVVPPRSSVESCQPFFAAGRDNSGFGSARWEYHVKDCPSSACWDFFSIDNKCNLSFQHDNQKQTALAAEKVCHWAAVMFTSPSFETAVKACPAGKGNVNEVFEVTGTVQVNRKLSSCNTPEMEQARECLRWIVAATVDSGP